MPEDLDATAERERKLFDRSGRKPAGDQLRNEVPSKPGVYAIFIDCSGSLSVPLGTRCHIEGAVDRIVSQMNGNESGKAGLLYVGMAPKRTLAERLFPEDLRGNGHASFFRSLGAVLGCAPCEGSLSSSNSDNYKFKKDDKGEIVKWIKMHLSATWVDDFGLEADIRRFETAMIKKYFPIFNIQKNPHHSIDLQDLRARCLEIARRRCD